MSLASGLPAEPAPTPPPRRARTVMPADLPVPPSPGGPPGGGPKLGELLLAQGEVTELRLRRALRLQRRSGARLGEILVSHRLAAPASVAAALARQRALPPVDPSATPPDPALVAAAPFAAMIAWRALPWRREPGRGGGMVFVTPEPDRAMARLPALRRAFGLSDRTPVALAVCTDAALDAALLALPEARRAQRASTRTPGRLSARGLTGRTMRAAIALSAAALIAALTAAPGVALPALFLAAAALNILNLGLRVAAMIVTRAPARRRMAPAAPRLLPPPGAAREALLPSVTLIVALYRERRGVAGLIRALEAIDYPRERMEVLLAVEEDDAETARAIAEAEPPPWFRSIAAPPGGPRTKPRALNHALDVAHGAIVGVYDAEDRPHPLQLRRVAEAFAQAPPRVACLQARLGFHNAGRGWLTRCFAIEYITWFHLILPALRRLGFPIPLGGTSLFIRRRVLERLGAWDAWNVTEDADLGIRLARAGYETELIDSETAEEAVERPLPWIRQRSRWQKGYVLTWACHMRNPLRLLRDLGPRGFIGFQLLFLGAGSAFLAQPLLWSAWIWWSFATDGWAVMGLGEAPALLVVASLHLGQGVMLVSSWVALKRAGRLRLALWAASLPFYWPLATLSAFKGLAELVLAPLFWDKTEHGLSEVEQEEEVFPAMSSPDPDAPEDAPDAMRRRKDAPRP